jgi:hypothetical protein
MPDITNAQALAFSNQKVRVVADLLESTYETCRRLVAEWNATSMISLIPNDATYVVRDSANPVSGAADGRKPINGAMISNIIARAGELKSGF